MSRRSEARDGASEWETPDFEVTPLDELEERRGFDHPDDPPSCEGADRPS